jgi:hypothetical protein
MSNDNLIELKKPDAFVDDPMTDISMRMSAVGVTDPFSMKSVPWTRLETPVNTRSLFIGA